MDRGFSYWPDSSWLCRVNKFSRTVFPITFFTASIPYTNKCSCFFLVSWGLVYRFAPEAKGSGIPQVMAAIESNENGNSGPLLEKLLGLKTLIIKILSSILCVLGGGAVGCNAPNAEDVMGLAFLVGGLNQFFTSSFQWPIQ